MQVFDKVKQRAIGSFYTKLMAAFAKKFTPNMLVENVITGTWDQPFVDRAIDARLEGVEISLRISRFLEAYISDVEIYVGNAPVSGNISVYDLDRGTLIQNFPYDRATNGFLTIPINTLYTYDRIGIFYDANVLQTRRTTYHDESYYNERCKPCGCTFTLATPGYINTGDEVIHHNFKTVSYPGMIVKYNVGCSLESFLCSQIERLAEPLWYKMGIEFFIEVMASPRINPTTLMNPELMDKIAAYCNDHFEDSMKTFIDGTTVNDKLCMVCTQPVQKAYIQL